VEDPALDCELLLVDILGKLWVVGRSCLDGSDGQRGKKG
jgi:hypothetical protein